MGALQVDTALGGEGVKRTAILSRDWEIWGPNGGYVASIALRAAGEMAPSDHRPAVFTCQYLSAAAFGGIEIEVEPLRQGRNAWLMNVRLTQAGRLFLQAQVWTTNKDGGPTIRQASHTEVPPPETLKPYQDYLLPGAPLHGFWSNFDAKPVRFLEKGEADERGCVSTDWYRFKDFDAAGSAYVDFARALILLDTLIWPAHHRGLQPKPDYIAPSLDLTVWFHDAPGAAEWLMADIQADVAGEGLIHGRGRIWTDDGRLVASGGSQLMHVPPRPRA